MELNAPLVNLPKRAMVNASSVSLGTQMATLEKEIIFLDRQLSKKNRNLWIQMGLGISLFASCAFLSGILANIAGGLAAVLILSLAWAVNSALKIFPPLEEKKGKFRRIMNEWYKHVVSFSDGPQYPVDGFRRYEAISKSDENYKTMDFFVYEYLWSDKASKWITTIFRAGNIVIQGEGYIKRLDLSYEGDYKFNLETTLQEVLVSAFADLCFSVSALNDNIRDEQHSSLPNESEALEIEARKQTALAMPTHREVVHGL
jgi:hypothetical protein